MITFDNKGNFTKIKRYFTKVKKTVRLTDLDKYGIKGVEALRSVTPIDTSLTANSWYYKITNENGVITISFYNSNLEDGVPIAILLQYGHGTRDGAWIQGKDYINPAIQPLFDEIVEEVWKEVTRV